MDQQNYTIVGVMSGTSLDGIDLALIRFENINQQWHYKILSAQTYLYEQSWIDLLKNAHALQQCEIESFNLNYTHHLAQQINKFTSQFQDVKIDAICSHGHTIIHKPKEGITIQIGNLPILPQLVKTTVVCDFRVQDVKLGGNGAPLVPLGDRILFHEYHYRINLGGFSNISYERDNLTLAYDICPVNTVLNRLAFPKNYDENGDISRSGIVNPNLLDQLNNLEYYKLAPPKSLGVEWVYDCILPLIESFDLSQQDKLCTFCEHIAYQIGKSIGKQDEKVLFTGGGVQNKYLMERIHHYVKNVQILDQQASDFKEALIFGLLGVLKLRNEINVLSSVTGASHDHSSGYIYKYQDN
ncbi:unnamed protein product [Paramecium octaurelia]|uniref:Anhydro-N-acetylmuramic acid kinase n=1 Tax=Paramecium octaurelia TaxID=43137 RepID=A0A8S1V2Q3_PAROT|nr:unnamed protein product [Paramecium octaurelia]